MKLILIIITLTLFSFSNFSQTEELPKKNNYKHNIGLYTGTVNGKGISYRYWADRIGFQLTGIPVFSQKKGHYLNVGLSALYMVNKGRKVDLYVHLGNSFESVTKYYTDYQGNKIITKQSNAFNIGVGFGFKFQLNEYLNLNLESGYGFNDIGNDFNSGISGGIGIYYNFN